MVVAALVVLALAGCVAVPNSNGDLTNSNGVGASCVAPSGQVPANATPGETVTIPLVNLWDPSSCPDTGSNGSTPSPRMALTEATVELRGPCSADSPVVASDTAKVNDDADRTATVHLAVPIDAHGLYWVVFSGETIGGMNVGLDPTASATNLGFDPTACATRA